MASKASDSGGEKQVCFFALLGSVCTQPLGTSAGLEGSP